MSYKIILRRGLKEDLPNLDEGELGYCIDTKEIFVGSNDGNQKLADHFSIQELLNFKANKEEVDIQFEDVASKFDKKASMDYVNEQLVTKADISHDHTLNSITDVDTSTSLPKNGDVLVYQNGTWKPSENKNSESVRGNMYVIELDRWGITQGIPSKPYVDADYIRADLNIQGINNALSFAKSNDFTNVVLPRGDYALCYPRTIQMESHMTFHLNGSTLKVIYDSDKKSPFDTRTGSDFYNFIGTSITFSNVSNTHLIGGTLIGCRADRSFANPNERSQEHTYGILLTRGTSFSSIKNCVVRDFMGDGISMDSRSPEQLAEFNLNLTLNSIDSTGQLIPSNNSLTSGFITLRDYSVFSIAGLGYSRVTNILTKEVDVFFYREDNSYLSKRQMNQKIYTQITAPIGAKKVRFVFRQETNPLKNMSITLRYGNPPHHNIIEKNEILANHRGGITLGGSYNVIQHNVIRDNGYHQLDDKPLFNDPTRYGINQEDSYGDNCVIRHNLIYNTNHGILAGCYSIHIENNHIYNVTGIGINLYTLSFATVKGNYLYRCGASAFGLMTANLPGAHVHITDNSVHHGIVNLNSSNGYTLAVRGNTFINVERINMPNSSTNVFKENIVKFTSQYQGNESVMLINKIQQCIYESELTNLLRVHFITNEMNGNTFHNINVYLDTRNSNQQREEVKVQDCYFSYSRLDNHIFGRKEREVNVSGSVFQNSRLYVGNINKPNENPLLSVEDSKFFINSITTLINNDINNEDGYGIIILKNCDIEIANANFGPLITNAFTRNTFEFYMKNCKLMYSGSDMLNLAYYSRLTSMRKFISANNQFVNINAPAEDTDFFVGYDPETHNINEPSKGYYHSTKIIYNANPIKGGYIGWVCIQEGFANQNFWEGNTSYPVGKLINANNNVYECTSAGTTGTTPPSHSSGTANDGSVSWLFRGKRARFAPFGLIKAD
ncbi:MAG: right-handed parallel beta-helix repeat-containing protein [Anaerobacillus sp.]|uniref:right-handed parallel beta-helix repeat-containing protein n=1 Tax=Anaerobacillus sp. TaxID=1872506 RepID=UPI00391D1436